VDKTVKSLIIIVVVLVAVLGVTGAIFLQGYLNNSNKNVTSANQTNITVNNNSNQTTSNNSNSKTETNSKLISSQEAINIVNKNVPAYGLTSYGAKLVQNGQHPYYLVTAYDQNPNSTTYREGIGGAKVDATTGQFLGGMG
jgi:cell division protein YceG involved in septum cleavage